MPNYKLQSKEFEYKQIVLSCVENLGDIAVGQTVGLIAQWRGCRRSLICCTKGVTT